MLWILVQQITVAIQRDNAASVMTFERATIRSGSF